MNIGPSYKQNEIKGSYDVIGSGSGGLGAAALLSKHAGKRVLVLERHCTAGGFTHRFRRPAPTSALWGSPGRSPEVC